MSTILAEDDITNWINGENRPAESGQWFDKLAPETGRRLFRVARSGDADVAKAIAAARVAQPAWADKTAVERGDLMRAVALRMIERKQEIAEIVAVETGKSVSQALGETQAAIEMGLFIAGEGRRYYGRTTTSSTRHRTVMTIRQPVGVAALIIASNTPIANVAWKAFPSMFCGNASIMKPSEDTPATAWIFGQICQEVGIPPGVFNLVHGLGAEAGMPLVCSPDVDLVSFTGSHTTGSLIQKVAGERLAKVCMELGGKNALVVCDDADLDNALTWVLASAFSNAGQRCAAGSRIIIFDAVYDSFRARLLTATRALKVGSADTDYLGPVINERHMEKMIAAVRKAEERGATILTGGGRMAGDAHRSGFFMAPTILENVGPNDDISQQELFGPVTILYRVSGLDEALKVVNNSMFGLTSSIHTDNLHRAMRYAEKAQAGVVVVNGGTHGSEPHMGFGGVKHSGTGWKEAGVEALDVYSETKYVNIISNPERI
jgi:aldehyde dehydrogenase (NAD+)